VLLELLCRHFKVSIFQAVSLCPEEGIMASGVEEEADKGPTKRPRLLGALKHFADLHGDCLLPCDYLALSRD